MSDTLAGHRSPKRTTWGKLPTPPSSGGSDSVTLHSDDRKGKARLLTGPEAEARESKRPCRRDSRILTPPSTRGRRMHDKLGLASEARRQPQSRHWRHCSDSFDGAWLLDDMNIASSSTSCRPLEDGSLAPALPALSRPVRDTPHNPFVEGGPADVGITGPNAPNALMRSMGRPPKDPSHTMFVFRGQRVVCSDKALASRRPYAADVGQSPLRPRLLFPPRQREGMQYDVPERNALSDDETSGPVGPSRKPPGRGLFARELASRAPGPSIVATDDLDASWLAGHAAAQDKAPYVEPPTYPPRTYTLPAKNRELLQRLESVQWADEASPPEEA